MAGQLPDPRTLNSWEDAFQHPLPVVRKLEQQLRKNIDDNRQKLRSLVGASYRDLLGTAERIIEMDDQVQTVENYLGDIGQKCNARTVEKIAESHNRMRRTKEARDGEVYKAMAQTKILQSTLTAAARIVKAGGNALQASKLFVLSRLLHKSISEGLQSPPVLQDLKRKLNALRSKLLLYIERSFTTAFAEKRQLGHVLCAYALVTSSNPKEVLRHFLQARYDHLVNKPDSPSEADVLRMLDVYSQTLYDARESFPARFADALSQLSRVPLLQDEQIQSIHELNIDIYGSWIADDVRTFTPWIRHDQLTSSEVASALESWTKQAQVCLLDGLKDHLRTQENARQILESRHRFISKFIGVSSKLRNAVSTSAIQDVRKAFLSKLEELTVQSASLNELTLDEDAVSNLAKTEIDESSLWDLATEDFDLVQGAFKLRQSILGKRHGRKERVGSENAKLDEWMKQVGDYIEIADQMGSSKWDDDLDFELEELDGGDALRHALTKDDPERLRERLRDACQASLDAVTTRINAAASSTECPTFYLRTWREIDLRRRALETRLDLPVPQISLVELHRNIGRSVSDEVVANYVRSAKLRARVTKTLWDGTPPLPVQPSPPAFRFLSILHREMFNTGADLWTPQCVFELKVILVGTLQGQLNDKDFTDPGHATELTNGHLETHNEAENNDQDASERPVTKASDNEQQIQNLFDIQYLHHVLDHSRLDSQDSGSLDSLIQAIRENSQLDDASNERLRKSAGEYWKRTYLLFGLLAPFGTMAKG